MQNRSKLNQLVGADHGSCEVVKSLEVLARSLIAELQAAIVAKPGEGSLDDVAKLSQAAPVSGLVDLRDEGNDSAIANTTEDVRRAVGAIALKDVRPVARSPVWSLNGRDGIEKIEGGFRVVDVGRSDLNYKRDAIRIGYDVALATSLCSIGGVWPGVDPPKTARIEALSTTARDQSMAPSFPSRLSKRRWISGQIPSEVQRASRRQQVQPLPHPSSTGRSFQGMPVFSTNRIPVRHFRSETRGRPPSGLGSRFGSSGAIAAQSSSVTNSAGMCTPLSRTGVLIGGYRGASLAVLH